MNPTESDWVPRQRTIVVLLGTLDDALRRIMAAEVPILRRVDLPLGSSIVCVAAR